MQYLDLTFGTSEENLACDEALLDMCEAGRTEGILRFWEPAEPFVVLGYAGRCAAEVHLGACRRLGVPIYRRISGGGAVLQGPGCLNYSLLLEASPAGPFHGIQSATRAILAAHREALESSLGIRAAIRGVSDLALGDLKFSGNSQRRRKDWVLFHGTFLCHFHIPLVEELLPVPARQPDYRGGRAHGLFLTNLHQPAHVIKSALKNKWGALEKLRDVPYERIRKLAENKYSKDEWNLRR